MLLRTPCSGGSRPVSSEACDGNVSGEWLYAFSNTIASRCSRSIAGVSTPL